MDARLKKLGEFGLIDHLVQYLPDLPAKRWVVGIGDDTSVLRISDQHYQLLTHDLLLEGVHFILESRNDYSDVGWKALAVNLSDIAAMGGIPQEAVVGLGIPPKAKATEVEGLYKGLGECASQFHCKVVGGDITRSKSGWVISVTVTGFSGRLPKQRKGAQVGDSLWVSGTLGGAALGWRARKKKDRSKLTLPFRKKHSRPTPRIAWAQRLGENSHITSMMDISDGLAGDLPHLVRANRLGFEVDVDKISRLDNFDKACQRLRVAPLELLLGGGEDYELLFTVRGVNPLDFSKWLAGQNICAATIGWAIKKPEIKWVYKGNPFLPKVKGFRHF